MWRGRAVVYNILGYLVFAVHIEMPFIVYREPRGGPHGPPGSPIEVGGIPPPQPPMRCASTRHASCLQKLLGWVL